MIDADLVDVDLAGISDGEYIRMSFEQFCALRFTSRRSFVDPDLRADLRAEDIPALRAGFCEWRDATAPNGICVGWAWFTVDDLGPPMVAPGGISSNVLLTANGRDLGMAKSNELLRAWLSNLSWQHDVETQHQPITPRFELWIN